MIIFQYSKPRGIDVLDSKRIMVTQPFKFNDPFEFRVAAERNMTRDQAIREIETEVELQKDLLKFFSERKIYLGNKRDFVAWFKANEAALLPKLIDSFKDGILIGLERIYEWESRIFGVACFSRRPNNMLMWSHYTDRHEGLMYVYDVKKLFPHLVRVNPGKIIRRVNYSDKMVILPPSLSGMSDDHDKVFDEMIYTKSKQWKYEKEYRLVHLIKKVEDPKDVGEPPFFVDISPLGIQQIVFGCKSEKKLIESAREIIRRDDLKHIILKKATINKTRYKLDYTVIPTIE